MSMRYRKGWNAICPKCGKNLSHADFTCTNCRTGKVKAFELKIDDTQFIQFGCEIEECGHVHAFVKCECGEVLRLHSKKKIHSSPKPAWA